MMAPVARQGLLFIVLVGITFGCGAPSTAPTGPAGSTAPAAVTQPTKVTIAVAGEVDDLSAKLGGGDTYSGEFNFLQSSPLAVRDGRGMAHPLLAAELPSRDNGSWVVNADGTMTTTWRIRPNANWHDGRPVTWRDFAFTMRVYQSQDMPVMPRDPERFMDRIEGLDDKTAVIYWKQTYPWANELISRDLEPLIPAHMMEQVFDERDTQAFLHHEFWKRDNWVGTGPYLMNEWVRGSFMDFRAWDGWFLGRPKIDQVLFRIIEDTNTVVANLFSGTVDMTVGVTLGQVAGSSIQQRWRESGDGQVIITPVRFRYVEVQHNPSYVRQPALLDVRVRRAIATGLDRDSLAEVVTAGTSKATDFFVSPTDAIYPQAVQVASKYPYDANRAFALLEEAGWTRRGESLVSTATGEPFAIEARTTTGTDNELEVSIITNGLRQLGMQVTQNALSEAAQRDNEFRVTFPGLNSTARSIRMPATMGIWVTSECPDPRQNFRGTNRGCWPNAEYDERARAIADGVRLITSEVGVIGLTYNSENLAVRKGLSGPGPRSSEQVGNTWNIHEWTWQS
ncbi:MAG: hypothetical protein HW416_3474 [Chloroflexi bacterium]|nr:hypothetical protein [Chloroflexota bacterium]